MFQMFFLASLSPLLAVARCSATTTAASGVHAEPTVEILARRGAQAVVDHDEETSEGGSRIFTYAAVLAVVLILGGGAPVLSLPTRRRWLSSPRNRKDDILNRR